VQLRGVALGILPRDKFAAILEDKEIVLAAGDLILGYSDGVSETHDRNEELYGEERLRAFCAGHASHTPQQLLATLRGQLESFADGCGQFDDITAVALRAELAAEPIAAEPLAGSTGRA
jgi:sigma-B regulation protein RsbU (phosphoserine phosphatase)